MADVQDHRRDEFIETLRTNAGDQAVAVAERIMQWSSDRGTRETYVPANVQGAGFTPVIRGTQKDTVPFSVTNGYPHVFLDGMR